MPKCRIIVTGALANLPRNGGNAIVTLQFVLGLHRLGFDVLFLEHVPAEGCLDTHGAPCAFEDSVQRSYFVDMITAFSLAGQSSLLYDGGRKSWGVPMREVSSFARDADALIGLGGFPPFREILASVKRRVYVDMDPVYTQLWTAVYDVDLGLAHADVLFTFGLNIGASACPIPTGGRRWHKLTPVVDLEFWQNAGDTIGTEKLTTVASWYGFAPLEYQGEWYGQKAEEFRRFIDLPARAERPVEVALSIHPQDPDRRLLEEHGWHIVDPQTHTSDPWSYRSYIANSRAEVGIAKNAYVKANSGWFSDRSAAYLASGKPVLVQDTGLASHFPLGNGLIPFRTLDELVEGLRELDARYPEHCRAARALAEKYFSAEKVLGRLLAEANIK